jgi:TonB family protein
MIKATLLLLCACGIIPLLRRRSAAERHLLWAASLAAASVVPLLALLLPPWQLTWSRILIDAFPSTFGQARPSVADQAADVIVRANGLEPELWGMATLLLLLWIAGIVLVLLCLGTRIVKLIQLSRTVAPLTDARRLQILSTTAQALRIRRPVQLLRSSRIAIPATWGLWHPRLVLPESADEWSDDCARAVFAHELAHVARGDWAVHIVAELSCAVYWFHPLFWLAKRGARGDSEHAADDVVLGLGMEPSEYAAHLLAVVRAAPSDQGAWSPGVAMGRRSQLEQRFAALLSATSNRRTLTRSKVVAIATLTAVVALSIAGMSLGAVGVNIQIRATDLPALVEAPSIPSQERAVPAVRQIRVVGRLEPASAITAPAILEYTTPPLYSDHARARGVEGTVTAGVHVDAGGRIGAVHVIRGLGFGLDQNAVVALRQWRLQPGTVNGAPAPMDAEVDIEFSLRNEQVNERIANDMATRVGPGVTPPRAVRIKGLWARRPAKRGTVVLDVIILEDGTPKIVKILQSLDPELDDSAVRNFAQWRFSPAIKNGRPVKVRVNAEVTFHG